MDITVRGSGFHARSLLNIDACLRRMVDRGEVAGVGALVIRHGSAAYQGSYGMRDTARRIPLENDSIYRIFSMTKTFTVVAAMTLYEKGIFRLDEPIQEYLPAFKNIQVAEHDERGAVRLVPARNPISFEHLFTMTSGIPYPGADSYGGRVFRDIHAAMTSDTARGKCRTTAQLAAAGLNGSAGEWAWDGALGTWYCVDPAEDLTAVFMIQRTPGGYDDLCRRFAQTVYGAIDD